MVVININGPAAIKSTIDFRDIHIFSLKRELIRPKIKIRSTHSASLGICFAAHHVKVRLRITTPAGNMQANKMEVCLTVEGQLCITATEKIIIKRVEQRKVLKAHSLQRANTVPGVGSVEFKGIYLIQ